MREHTSVPLTAPLQRGAVCVVEGYGVRIQIRRGHLVVDDGFGRERRQRVFNRATHGLSRVVVLGHEGSISFEAIRWLADLGISYQQIDRDGRLLASSSVGSGDARLRRQQAVIAQTQNGLELARQMLTVKLEGQRWVLGKLTDRADVFEEFDASVAALAVGRSVEALREAERQAALTYWREWSGLDCRFAKRDMVRVPEHWRTFGSRHSPISSSSRLAVTPLNAILNYLYALLAAETRNACLIVGLDPGLGIVHVDYRNRDSFVLDLMEVARPAVDEYVLELAQTHTFRATDFGETRRGVCRVLAPFAHQLARTGPQWREAVAPFAEHFARALAELPDSRIDTLATPLTRTNRARAGSRGFREAPKAAATRRIKPDPTCQRCGQPVPTRDRVYCDTCLPDYQREQFSDAFSGSGLASIERSKQTGHDPTHTPEAERKRGATIAERKKAVAEWETKYGKLTDMSAFDREILPLIQQVPLSRLMKATGLSLRYVSQIRRGEKRPHPRHWARFAEAGQE